MSENLQKKIPIIMLSILILVSVVAAIARQFGSAEIKSIVEKSHFYIAIVVLIIGAYLLYLKSRNKK
jgi:hypothetical protein